jgi:hypothetical protein
MSLTERGGRTGYIEGRLEKKNGITRIRTLPFRRTINWNASLDRESGEICVQWSVGVWDGMLT